MNATLLILISLIIGTCIILVFTIREWKATAVHSKFSLLDNIPATEDLRKQISQQREATASLRGGISELVEFAYRILIIDDEIDTRTLYRLRFKQQEKKHIIALFFSTTVTEARTLLQSIKFDLLILDICIENQSGIDFMLSLKQEKNLTPIIVVSAFIDNGIKQILEKHDIPYIVKPIEFIALTEKMNNIMGSRL